MELFWDDQQVRVYRTAVDVHKLKMQFGKDDIKNVTISEVKETVDPIAYYFFAFIMWSVCYFTLTFGWMSIGFQVPFFLTITFVLAPCFVSKTLYSVNGNVGGINHEFARYSDRAHCMALVNSMMHTGPSTNLTTIIQPSK